MMSPLTVMVVEARLTSDLRTVSVTSVLDPTNLT